MIQKKKLSPFHVFWVKKTHACWHLETVIFCLNRVNKQKIPKLDRKLEATVWIVIQAHSEFLLTNLLTQLVLEFA